MDGWMDEWIDRMDMMDMMDEGGRTGGMKKEWTR